MQCASLLGCLPAAWLLGTYNVLILPSQRLFCEMVVGPNTQGLRWLRLRSCLRFHGDSPRARRLAPATPALAGPRRGLSNASEGLVCLSVACARQNCRADSPGGTPLEETRRFRNEIRPETIRAGPANPSMTDR